MLVVIHVKLFLILLDKIKITVNEVYWMGSSIADDGGDERGADGCL